MERLKERLDVAEQALVTFEELAGRTAPTAIERDAAIQRFEYSFEAVFRAAQQYLRAVEGIDVASPKGLARASLRARLLDEAEAQQALVMVDDRNLTSHTYNRALAEEIFSRIPGHAALLRRWLEAMGRGVGAA